MIKKNLVLTIVLLSVLVFVNIAAAEDIELSVMGHAVHKSVATEGEFNVIEDWLASESQVESINWQTYSIAPLHERLFREASLPSTHVDVAYLLNTYASPRIENLLTPLDKLMENNPLPGFPEDYFSGMIDALTINDKLYGIPIRAATSTLHFNEALLNERGLEGAPESIEDFYSYAKRLTYTREDGTTVYGFAINGVHLYANVIDVLRAYDGDIITEDYEVVADQPAAITGVKLLAKMYEEGLMPKDLPVMDSTDVNKEMQLGRIAMTISSGGRTEFYNDPEQSNYPGSFKVSPLPISEIIADEYDVAPAKTEFWSLVIPRNSENKEIAWRFIKNIASAESDFKMAYNGNGPVRASTYNSQEYLNEVSYADVLGKVLNASRVPLPAFNNSARAESVINEYLAKAIYGKMDPENAMKEMAEELKTLVPKQ